MKKTIFFLSIFLLALHSCGIAQNYEWAKFLGGSSTNESATDIAVDANGNVYSVGRFFTFAPQPVDFDPGPGVFAFNLPGTYISKLNSNGELVWARNLPETVVQGISIHASRIESIAIDPEGNIVISGNCTSGADLNAGPGVFTLPELAPYVGGFIAKYSAAGNFMWAKALPITPLNYDPNSPANLDYYFNSKLATDNESNIIMGITFQAQIDGDPGPDTLSFTTGQATNVLILKLTSSGNLIGAKQIFGDIALTEITTDVNNQIYLCGSYNFALFDFQNPSPFPTANLYDGYILKLTENEEFVWVKTMGGLSYDNVNSIKTDAIGNVYCTGYFIESAWFNNATDSLFLNSLPAGGGGFTAKLDSSVNWKWAKSFGGNTDTLSGGVGTKIEVDSIGNTYTLAAVSGNVVFSPDSENVTESFNGSSALAIIKHNNDGDLIRVRKADGDIRIIGRGLALDAEGNLFFNGDFIVTNNSNGIVGTGAIDMDPSSDTAALVGFGSGQDCIFVAKWSQCSAGTTTLNETACNNYQWNNETYTQSGIYAKSLTTALGCDSIARLNLTVLNNSQASQNVQICAGETFSIGNQTFNQSGIYETTLTASTGCDSLVTTNLTVDTLNTAIVLNDNVFTALNIPQNVQLQWLNCDTDFSAIANEVNPTFIASSDGNYALETTLGNCRDTSNCVLFSSVGLNSITSNHIKIYPIPADETLFIESEKSNLPIRIFDAQGRLIFETITSSKGMEIDVRLFQSGLYFIQTKNTSKPFTVLHSR